MTKDLDLINKFNELINESVEYCNSRKDTKEKIKCIDCKFNWNFSIGNNGCFLVDAMESFESVNIYNELDKTIKSFKF